MWMWSEEARAAQKKIDDAQLTRLNVERELYGDMTMAGTERMNTEAGENLKKIVETPVSLEPSPRGLGEIDGKTLADRAREKFAESVGGRFDELVGLVEAKAVPDDPPDAPDDPSDIEALAAAEHESWSGWSNHMLDRLEREIRESYGKRRRGERSNRDRAAQEAVDEFRALPGVQRWRRQASTPYDQLPMKERESDRVEARKKLKVYRLDGS